MESAEARKPVAPELSQEDQKDFEAANDLRALGMPEEEIAEKVKLLRIKRLVAAGGIYNPKTGEVTFGGYKYGENPSGIDITPNIGYSKKKSGYSEIPSGYSKKRSGYMSTHDIEENNEE